LPKRWTRWSASDSASSPARSFLCSAAPTTNPVAAVVSTPNKLIIRGVPPAPERVPRPVRMWVPKYAKRAMGCYSAAAVAFMPTRRRTAQLGTCLRQNMQFNRFTISRVDGSPRKTPVAIIAPTSPDKIASPPAVPNLALVLLYQQGMTLPTRR